MEMDGDSDLNSEELMITLLADQTAPTLWYKSKINFNNKELLKSNKELLSSQINLMPLSNCKKDFQTSGLMDIMIHGDIAETKTNIDSVTWNSGPLTHQKHT